MVSCDRVCCLVSRLTVCVYPIIFESSVVYREQELTRHAHVTGSELFSCIDNNKLHGTLETAAALNTVE